MTKDEEEEMKVEKENMAKTSFTNHRAMHMDSSTEPKSNGNYVLHFDVVKEGTIIPAHMPLYVHTY